MKRRSKKLNLKKKKRKNKRRKQKGGMYKYFIQAGLSLRN